MRYVLVTFAFGLLVSSGFAHPQTGSGQGTGVPQESAQRYFLPGAFGQSAYKERCYTSFLIAMREPSLFETARTADITEYRLLMVFHDRALSFRLELLVDGAGELTVARAIPGGNSNGVLMKVPVSPEHVSEFLALLQRAGFWRLGTQETHENDGLHWVLEGVRNHEHHVVDRSSPIATDFARVCVFLTTLASANPEEDATGKKRER